MIIGTLGFKKQEQQLFLSPKGEHRTHRGTIPLEPGMNFEISLAGIWIPVQLRVEYGEGNMITSLLFVTSTSSFCGFAPGMVVRLLQLPEEVENE